ncbi:hypothetical protein SCARD494_06193 [Seiridium cardinale]
MMDNVQKQEFQIRELGTRSVTLFPNSAQVIRGVSTQLKPGTNQITIIGLSPTVDEHSIKVEGTGSAIITDIAIENRPNREIFEDIYPDSDNSEDDSSDSEHDDEDATDDEGHEIKTVRESIATLLEDQKRAKEIVASANSRLKIIDSYGQMLTSLPTGTDGRLKEVDISGGLDTYKAEREKIYQDFEDGSGKEREITARMTKLRKEEIRLTKLAQREKKKASKAKTKARRAKEREERSNARKLDKVAKEKTRLRRERESFWPKNVYTVKVSLEATGFTPLSSRRGSVSSDLVTLAADTVEQAVEDEPMGTCDLTLTYVTSYAYWSPSYDLALSTTANSGTLCFDAQLTNMTSETWSNCKVVLSTSQADFSGLNDKIPTLVPWRVRLAGAGVISPPANSFNQIMFSREESSQKAEWAAHQTARKYQKPRAQLFGLENANPFGIAVGRTEPAYPAYSQNLQSSGGGLFGSSKTTTGGFGGIANSGTASAFGPMASNSNNTGGSLFASNANAPPPVSQPGGLFGSAKSSAKDAEKNDRLHADVQAQGELSPEELRHIYGSIGNPAGQEPELDFQESSFEETGFTSTYELPGLKNLAPSSTTSKQRVARVTFASVAFSHTVVAKYKPAAYLKARIQNGSKLTLLRGPASLTLDGSFMGRSNLPRCSTGDFFTLSLGIDPAIRVAYPKPDVKRSQSGLFSKEDSSAFTRLITLSNTRSGGKVKPVNITVLDQVPVSEDEKLRIDILQPRGLVVGGSGVAAGAPGREGKDQADWGRASATLKKGGEISWDVRLSAGRSVKLELEYECSFPAGEHAINV